jgi:prepilin signal peptidase PulO-like enzyme (type II secretory pathway)
MYRKIFALFIGYKTKKIKRRFATSIEKNINNEKEISFSLLENENTWVTPSIPLIIFIFIGYIISILYGDILKMLIPI